MLLLYEKFIENFELMMAFVAFDYFAIEYYVMAVVFQPDLAGRNIAMATFSRH